jgi:hypothetical protein
MTDQSGNSIELLGRPEPRFEEGRRFPRTGLQGRVLWIILVLLLSAAVVAACAFHLTVNVEMSGSVVDDGGRGRAAVLFVDSELGIHLAVGQPVRLSVGHSEGWGIVAKVDGVDESKAGGGFRADVAILGPEPLLESTPNRACQGRVLVGRTRFIRALWSLILNRPVHPTRVDLEELRDKIPVELKSTDHYKRFGRPGVLNIR